MNFGDYLLNWVVLQVPNPDPQTSSLLRTWDTEDDGSPRGRKLAHSPGVVSGCVSWRTCGEKYDPVLALVLSTQPHHRLNNTLQPTPLVFLVGASISLVPSS